jgi:putative FmdB family regulatory protein
MPTYEFQCQECKHEWEDFMSIKAPDPEECPKCKIKGKVLRLISGGSGKGVVELTGEELIKKSREDAQKFKKEVYGSEKHYSNIIGEGNYGRIQSGMDRRGR